MVSLGWLPVLENGYLITLKKEKASITLEPGGQIELSGTPLKNIHKIEYEIKKYHKDIKLILQKLNLITVPLGTSFFNSKYQWLPKTRYKLMKEYIIQCENNGLNMMYNTISTQINLDYISEQDMAKKLRIAFKLQPIILAIFANSPFTSNGISKKQSQRNYYWAHTDPARCGLISEIFHKSFNFESYIDYALKIPMYFIKRGNNYLDTRGQSFKDFIQGRLPSYPGLLPTTQDWSEHLSTIFTEVRLKKYIEMRIADGGNKEHILALSALWTGIFYNENTLNFCDDLTKQWTFNDIKNLIKDSRNNSFQASIKGIKIIDISKIIISQAIKSLQIRSVKNLKEDNETIYLNMLKWKIKKGTNSNTWKKYFIFNTNQNPKKLLVYSSKIL